MLPFGRTVKCRAYRFFQLEASLFNFQLGARSDQTSQSFYTSTMWMSSWFVRACLWETCSEEENKRATGGSHSLYHVKGIQTTKPCPHNSGPARFCAHACADANFAESANFAELTGKLLKTLSEAHSIRADLHGARVRANKMRKRYAHPARSIG